MERLYVRNVNQVKVDISQNNDLKGDDTLMIPGTLKGTKSCVITPFDCRKKWSLVHEQYEAQTCNTSTLK